jgi:hypothetical protein
MTENGDPLEFELEITNKEIVNPYIIVLLKILLHGDFVTIGINPIL